MQQSLENYLKGILLFNNIKYKNGHRLKTLLNKVLELEHVHFEDNTLEFIKKLMVLNIQGI